MECFAENRKYKGQKAKTFDVASLSQNTAEMKTYQLSVSPVEGVEATTEFTVKASKFSRDLPKLTCRYFQNYDGTAKQIGDLNRVVEVKKSDTIKSRLNRSNLLQGPQQVMVIAKCEDITGFIVYVNEVPVTVLPLSSAAEYLKVKLLQLSEEVLEPNEIIVNSEELRFNGEGMTNL